MKFWPFTRGPKKPSFTINLNKTAMHTVGVAGAWTTYAGTKGFVRTGEYFSFYPEAKGHDSPFDEECYARDAMAEYWAKQTNEEPTTDSYLHLLVEVRAAGFIREYVWTFLRDPSWVEPAGLNQQAFTAWWAGKGVPEHMPPTHAFLSLK